MTESGKDNNVLFVRDYDHRGPEDAAYNAGDMDTWREDAERRMKAASSEGVQPQDTGAYIADQLHPAAGAVEQVPPVPQQ